MAFGDLSGLILVGNFGDGTINAYDNSGSFVGTVRDASNKPPAIDGLWSLTLGGGQNSDPATLYFAAGPNGETDGYFGTVTPIQ
jgi:uncharacterized protein (TIGR03118 family)